MVFVASNEKRCLSGAGGNGKQIFGDAWWLEPERVSGAASAFPAGSAAASGVVPAAQLSGFAGDPPHSHSYVNAGHNQGFWQYSMVLWARFSVRPALKPGPLKRLVFKHSPCASEVPTM